MSIDRGDRGDRGDGVGGDAVELTIPAALEYVRIARLVVSGLASRLGFDVEEIEDLRVAIDELSSLLVEAHDGAGTVRLVLRAEDGGESISVAGERPGGAAPAPHVDELTKQILAAVVDEWNLDATDGGPCFRFTKRVGRG